MKATVSTKHETQTIAHDGIAELYDRTAITLRNMAFGASMFGQPLALVRAGDIAYVVHGQGTQAQARRVGRDEMTAVLARFHQQEG
jgi:uncharacterized protein (UPF0297 family)